MIGSDEALEASCAQADGNSWPGVGRSSLGSWGGSPGLAQHSPQSRCAHRSERETAVRISQEIGNLMKEIETLVEEKTKESLDVSRLTREGERMELGAHRQSWDSQAAHPTFVRQHPPQHCTGHCDQPPVPQVLGLTLAQTSVLPNFLLARALRAGLWLRSEIPVSALT